jgi:hypothetical protein
MIAAGAEIDARLTKLAEERRLSGQLNSGFVRHVAAACEAADLKARPEIGAVGRPLKPNSDETAYVSAARTAAYEAALKTAPQKQKARPQKRLYDKPETAAIYDEVAAKHEISVPLARSLYSRWKRLKKRLKDDGQV